jgi:hypothetical protein
MLFKRLVCSGILLAFGLTGVIPSSAYSQNIPHTPANILSLTPVFHPVMVQGMRVHPDNPLEFDFIVDTGDASVDVNGRDFREETTKLIKYFLASLTVPEKEMWVNLSPYEKNRIIADGLGQTELGQDMLAQDYILKQLTSSLIYPDSKTGKAFWEKVYAKTRETFGTTNIPINTFNKVWIVPDKAVVYERGNTVYVVESHLKVMLEEDYLALIKHQGTLPNTIASPIVRQIIIPELEKEVNTGKNFANLRQIYNAMILAVWYKINLQKSLLGQVYADKNKTAGVDATDKAFRQKIYSEYIKSFKKGVYNYIREENDPVSGVAVVRKYFSGGLVGEDAAMLKVETGPAPPQSVLEPAGKRLKVNLRFVPSQNPIEKTPGKNIDYSMLTEKKIFSVIKLWARDNQLSDENRGILIENLSPALVQRIDGILKNPNGREAVLRTTQNQLLHFMISAGLVTGPPGVRVSAVFEQITDHLQRIIDQEALSPVERNLLESTMQAYHSGYSHGGAIYTDTNVLDGLFVLPTRELKKNSDDLPDTLLDDIQKAPLSLIGQGFTSFTFATPDGKSIIKYIKTKVSVALDVAPEDHRFPQQSWAHDYGVTNGKLHPGLWEEIELFETYGELGLSGRIYITKAAKNSLIEEEQKRLERYIKSGIVLEIDNPVEITPYYPPGVSIFDIQRVKQGKISISVLLAYPRIVSLKDKFAQALNDRSLTPSERLEQAKKWMDASFSFIEELWEQGIFHTDATFFNIGIQTLGDGEEQLAVLDPHHDRPVDFSSGLPLGETEQSIGEYMKRAKDGSHWALTLVQQEFHQEDSEFFRELFSHFEQKSREVLTFENFQKHWRPFPSNIVSVFQKEILYNHPLFKRFLEAERGQYDNDSIEQPLEVQGSGNLKAGIKNYDNKRLIVVFNPTDVHSSYHDKEWGRIMIGESMGIKKDAIYLLKEILTGEVYVRTGAQLAQGFSVGLAPYYMHLFTIEETHGPLPAYYGGSKNWEFNDVIDKIDITPYVLPGFPATMILHIRNDFPLHLLESSYVEFKGKGGIIEKHSFKLIPDDNGNFVLGQTVFFPEPGDHPFEITLDVNGQILKYKGTQKVEVPQPNELWQHGPLIVPIDENLFFGNASAAAHPEELTKNYHIMAVANASEERDLSPVYFDNPWGIEYRQFGAPDMSYNPIPETVLREGANWINHEISSGKPVFIHCHAGIGRASSLLIAYLFLFKYPDKSFDEVVDMVRAAAVQAGHFIYPHKELAQTLERLREATSSMGQIYSLSFAGEYSQEGATYSAVINKPVMIRVKVAYGGNQPPKGVFVNTNLNKDGAGENIFMRYNPVNELYEAWVTPQRTGDHFWLTAFALPHRNDHPDQRKWIGQNIHFQIKDAAMKVVKDNSAAPGGIDLNSTMLNLQVKREGKSMTSQATADSAMQVSGFRPVIIRITPMDSPLFSDAG